MDETSRQDCQGYFDAESKTWSERYHRKRSFQDRLRTICSLLPPAQGAGTLAVDLGCGGGVICELLNQRGYRAVGVDLSLEMVRRTRQTLAAQIAAGRCTVVQADVCRVPLPDACASLVLSSAVIEYVPDDRAALTEIARLTRPAGHAIIAVPNRQSVLRRAEALFSQGLRRVRNGRECDGELGRYQFLCYQHHQYRRVELLNLLEEVGLAVERDRYCVTPGLHWAGRLLDCRWAGMMWILRCRRTG